MSYSLSKFQVLRGYMLFYGAHLLNLKNLMFSMSPDRVIVTQPFRVSLWYDPHVT